MRTRWGANDLTLATRSDLGIEVQVTAQGATWLDRRLMAQRLGGQQRRIWDRGPRGDGTPD